MATEEDGTQYVYFVTNEGNVEGIQPQIVFFDDQRNEILEDSNSQTASTDIWTKCNGALRDLLVYLVKKYRIEDVMDSKLKAQQWDKLTQEFYVFFNEPNLVSKQQIVRKWHNWKQYNKAKRKPHPFALVPQDLDPEIIREKCQKLLENSSPETYLQIDQQNLLETISSEIKFPLQKLNRIKRRDFLVRRTGASASALSSKRLEHELVLESLNFKQEEWKLKSENQLLIKEKLTRKLQLTDIKLEAAKLELEMLRSKYKKE